MIVNSRNLLSLVTLFFNSSVINDLERDDYVPFYLDDSYYFFHNLSDSHIGPLPVENDLIFPNHTFFPKCCKPGTYYDIDNRGCLFSNNLTSIVEELDVTVNLIQSGLVNCPVILDRFVKKDDLKRKNGNATLQIGTDIYEPEKFCIDNIGQNGDVYVVRLCQEEDYCANVSKNIANEWCVRKCCNDGFAMENLDCTLGDTYGIRVEKNAHIYDKIDGYAMMYRGELDCERSNWKHFQEVSISIKANGSLFLRGESREFKMGDFCLSTNYDTSKRHAYDMVFYCEFRKALYAEWMLIKIAVFITCICFVLTLAVYIFVYKLEKRIEKIIACFCLVDLAFWSSFAVRTFQPRFGAFCTTFAGTLKTIILSVLTAYIYFFITVSRLSWLNVLSYEIWATIGSLGQFRCKNMIYYTTYAIVVPMVGMIFFILGNQEVYPLPYSMTPYVNRATCFIDIRRLDGNMGHLHLYIPVLILIIINIYFFVKTLMYYLKTKRDLKKISDANIAKQRRINETKETAFRVLKIGLIMGITWLYYVYAYINSFHRNEILEHIGDVLSFINIFEGVYFFGIFVVKWRTVTIVLQNMNIISKNVISQSASTTSNLSIKSVDENGLSMTTSTQTNSN